MFGVFTKSQAKALFFLLILASTICLADEGLDKTRYITIDEIKPGMKAWCLTTYKGTLIEKFDLEVLDVVYNIEPNRNAIMVQGTGDRFIHTGPVAGCSGSPVYIDGRLAGALAFGWLFSKDPLYGVTPIEEMLRVGKGANSESQSATQAGGFVFDFSKPLDFAEINKKIKSTFTSKKSSSFLAVLPCPVITSGLSAQACSELDEILGPLGFMAVSGAGGTVNQAAGGDQPAAKLVPGAPLAVPLVTGDITITAIGTVTEVVGDKVYGFGHSFLGFGPIDLPMATGRIHTVVSSVMRSFKLGSAGEIVGALTADESTAIYGKIGKKAKMIPLTIKVERYNDLQKRTYNCRLAYNRYFTPRILNAAVKGATYMLGNLPIDNTIEYKVAITGDGFEPIIFQNVSTGVKELEMIAGSIGSVALLMNNPYKEVEIKSIDFDIRILPKNIYSHIWSVDLSDTKIKAGESVDISVILESVLAGKKKYQYSLKIPENLSPGKYELMITGGHGYLNFLRKTASYKFIPQNLRTMVEIINEILGIARDKLYCVLVLPNRGLAIGNAEMPDLPPTKALIFANSKRSVQVQPFSKRIEKIFQTDTIVVNKKSLYITVEK